MGGKNVWSPVLTVWRGEQGRDRPRLLHARVERREPLGQKCLMDPHEVGSNHQDEPRPATGLGSAQHAGGFNHGQSHHSS